MFTLWTSKNSFQVRQSKHFHEINLFTERETGFNKRKLTKVGSNAMVPVRVGTGPNKQGSISPPLLIPYKRKCKHWAVLSLFPCPHNMFPKCPICSPKVRKGMGWLHARVVRVTVTCGQEPMWMGYDDSSWDCNPRTRFRVLVKSGDALRGANILGQVGT